MDNIIGSYLLLKEILTVVAEVGIEAEGSTVKFQSLSAAQGRVTDTMIRSVAESTIKWRAKNHNDESDLRCIL
jgi:hypothetical protein